MRFYAEHKQLRRIDYYEIKLSLLKGTVMFVFGFVFTAIC